MFNNTKLQSPKETSASRYEPFRYTIVIQIYKKKPDCTNRRTIITSWRMFHLWETSIAFWTLWSYDDVTQHKIPSVCTELVRSKTFGKIKRRRCCGTRAKVLWGMSNIFAGLVTHVVETQRGSTRCVVFKLADLCNLYESRLIPHSTEPVWKINCC